MNYALLSVILLTVPLAAMDLKVLDPRTIQSTETALPLVGGVQALVSATKNGTEIVIISYAPSEDFTSNALSRGDRQAKDWVIPQLEMWSNLEIPTALITFSSENVCKDHAKRLQKGRGKKEFHMPLHAEINALGVLSAYKHGNLHILRKPHLLKYEDALWDVTIIFTLQLFPHLAQKAKLPLTDVRKLTQFLATQAPSDQKRFFGEEGSFSRFKQEARKTLSKLGEGLFTIDEYFDLIEETIKEAEALYEETTNRFLKKELTTALNRLKTSRSEIRSYLGTYGITNYTTTLFEALCIIITHRREITATTLKFTKEFYAPVVDTLNLCKYAAVITTTNTYKQVVLLFSQDKAHDLVAFLAASGFTIEAQGRLPVIRQGDRHTLLATPFSKLDALSFLQSRFGGSALVKIPEIAKDSPIAQLTYTRTSALSLFEGTSTAVEEPTYSYDKDELCCRYCPHRVEKSQAQIGDTCSYHCLLRHLFLKRGALKKLLLKQGLSKQGLSGEEQAVLSHLGALCYLRSCTLSPLVLCSTPSFSLTKTIQLLTTILEQGKHDQAWVRACALAQRCHIDVKQLRAFCTSYQEGIKEHRQAVKEYKAAVKKVTNKLFMPVLPAFDPKEVLAQEQISQCEALDTVFLLEKKQDPQWYPRVHYTLMHTLGFVPTELSKALMVKVTKKAKKSIDEILKDLN